MSVGLSAYLYINVTQLNKLDMSTRAVMGDIYALKNLEDLYPEAEKIELALRNTLSKGEYVALLIDLSTTYGVNLNTTQETGVVADNGLKETTYISQFVGPYKAIAKFIYELENIQEHIFVIDQAILNTGQAGEVDAEITVVVYSYE
jgi:hypothetical protein